ncbi:hypothetical protein BS78_K046400 [Paspalum vaginatum]|uniref:Uncharacterized protein n=1 Tax=Paspalum vaginatum TaxID=158149 RepID=A0A9W8CFY6_9POAL|nr:hypothetical protein BS78_K046400 [Paspalum vaginatum]
MADHIRRRHGEGPTSDDASSPVGIAMTNGADTQDRNNAESDRREEEAPPNRDHHHHHLNLEEAIPAFFKGLPAVDLVQVLSFFVKMGHNKPTAIAYLMSFLLSFCLHAVVIGGSRCIQEVNNRRHIIIGFIAYLSAVLRMLGAAALLLFLDDNGSVVHSVAMLAPFLLVLVLLVALSWWTFLTGEVVGVNWGEFEEDLKLRFDLSVNVVYMAFAGLAGRVVNNGGAGTAGFMAQAPGYLLFYGLVLGLLHVLLCTVPPRAPFRQIRLCMAKVYMPLLAYVALLLVVLASVVAAQDLDILRINVFFGLFAIIVFIVIVFSRRNYRACTATVLPLPGADRPIHPREQDAYFYKYLMLGYFMPLFALVISVHIFQVQHPWRQYRIAALVVQVLALLGPVQHPRLRGPQCGLC